MAKDKEVGKEAKVIIWTIVLNDQCNRVVLTTDTPPVLPWWSGPATRRRAMAEKMVQQACGHGPVNLRKLAELHHRDVTVYTCIGLRPTDEGTRCMAMDVNAAFAMVRDPDMRWLLVMAAEADNRIQVEADRYE